MRNTKLQIGDKYIYKGKEVEIAALGNITLTVFLFDECKYKALNKQQFESSVSQNEKPA